mmetsp:Transcript_26982/g.88594  ORF Transcript_26982/g.88594 Transcript_26982/m.88594 type:complete len:239 (-) Transcript_26982:663-1379(-)
MKSDATHPTTGHHTRHTHIRLYIVDVVRLSSQLAQSSSAECPRISSRTGHGHAISPLSSVSGSDPLERPLTAAAQQLTHRARPKRGAAERLRRRESVVPAPRRQRCHSSHPSIVRTAGAAAIGAAIGAAVRPCTPLPEQPGRGKLERCRVQEHAVGAPVGAVRDVADDGVADVRHVQPQLVAPPRVRRQPQQRRLLPSVRRQHEPAARSDGRRRPGRLARGSLRDGLTELAGRHRDAR